MRRKPVKMCNHRSRRNGVGHCWLKLDDLREAPIKEERYHAEELMQRYSRMVFAWDGRGETIRKEEYARIHEPILCDKSMSEACPFREWKPESQTDKPKNELMDCPYCKRRHFKNGNAWRVCEAWHKVTEIFDALDFHKISWLPQGSRIDPYDGISVPYDSTASSILWYRMRNAILKRDDHRCQLCKRQSDKYNDGSFRDQILSGRKTKWGYDHYDTLEVHHIIPRLEGGTDHPTNLITVCTSCHSKLTGAMLSRLADARAFMDALANSVPIDISLTEEEILIRKFGKGKELFDEIVGSGGGQ